MDVNDKTDFIDKKNFKIRDDKCGCTGSRSCLICESYRTDKFFDPNKVNHLEVKTRPQFYFCPGCGDRAWRVHDVDEELCHELHSDTDGESIKIEGIFVSEEVISREEELFITDQINQTPWVNSQSGRRKQDFGPRVNFKKKKVSVGSFQGLPKYIKHVWERIHDQFPEKLGDFLPVELCNLEYDPERGSSIEPHFDDFWIWGDRLVTINYLSKTLLTLTRPREDIEEDIEICIPMNPRSLLILSGEARTKWLHEVKRKDVKDRRIATTLRELSLEFIPSDSGEESQEIGRQLIQIGSQYI